MSEIIPKNHDLDDFLLILFYPSRLGELNTLYEKVFEQYITVWKSRQQALTDLH